MGLESPCNFPPVSSIAVSCLLLQEAMILWNGEERTVRVVGTGRRPLLGTAMLEEAELVIQFTEGGLVTIED
ncbi:MAG: hypothetical protein F6K54_19000 [Okeania sp. SIO3B5]|nr:hypothetical protein [Okeania sp. SIO3B5]